MSSVSKKFNKCLLTDCPQQKKAVARLIASTLKGSSVTGEDTEKCHIQTKLLSLGKKKQQSLRYSGDLTIVFVQLTGHLKLSVAYVVISIVGSSESMAKVQATVVQ